MHRSAIRVARYLASVNPGSDVEDAVTTITRQSELVDSPDLSPSTPAADLLFGLPASFWLDEREYDPVAAAAKLGKPMLVLQGGRDYQVTVQDDLTLWREGLGSARGPGRGRRHRRVAGTAPERVPFQAQDSAAHRTFQVEMTGWSRS